MYGGSPSRTDNYLGLASKKSSVEKKTAITTGYQKKTLESPNSRKKWGQQQASSSKKVSPQQIKVYQTPSKARADFDEAPHIQLREPLQPPPLVEEKHAVMQPLFGLTEEAAQYEVVFRVRYETIVGQSLYVMGSIPELGSWKEFVCPLTWSEGHFWQTEDFVVSSPCFSYKYVVRNGGECEPTWEKGIDRIADLRILKSQFSSREVVLDDKWEHFKV